MTTRAESIRNYIHEHPGCTSRDIATALTLDETRVAATLWAEVEKKKLPVIRREEGRRSITNTPVFKYFYEEKPAPRIEKPAPLEKKTKPLRGVRPVATISADTDINTLVNQISDSIAAYIINRVRQQLAQLTVPISPSEYVSPAELVARLSGDAAPAAVKKKPTVLVAGLLPMQAGKIQRAFNDVYDLRFFEVGGNLQQLRDMVVGSDYVFTFTSKIPHKVEEIIKSVGKPIHRCSGGLTMLESLMLDLYVQLDEEGK